MGEEETIDAAVKKQRRLLSIPGFSLKNSRREVSPCSDSRDGNIKPSSIPHWSGRLVCYSPYKIVSTKVSKITKSMRIITLVPNKNRKQNQILLWLLRTIKVRY